MWYMPRHVCEALYRVNKSARYAWVGEHAREGELNPGHFALVQLYPSKRVGSLDEPSILNELWYVTDGVNEHKQIVRKRIDRGTIFNRHGDVTPDWDPVEFIPVYVARFVDYHVSDQAVYDGSCAKLIQRWMESPRDRLIKSAEEAGRRLKRKAREIGEEGGKRLWYEASKTGQTSPLVPYGADVRKEMDEFFQHNEGLEDYYNPNKPMHGTGRIL